MPKFDSTNWRADKIVSVKHAQTIAADLKKQGKQLVTVNGSFDLLHAGHLDQLEEAKQQGDYLLIGINSDNSIQKAKGASRPLVTAELRAAMLAALACTDYVIIIDAPYNKVQDVLIETVKPHIHVNGPDYGKPETWIEYPLMQKYGTRGYNVTLRNDLSTSAVIEKIKE